MPSSRTKPDVWECESLPLRHRAYSGKRYFHLILISLMISDDSYCKFYFGYLIIVFLCYTVRPTQVFLVDTFNFVIPKLYYNLFSPRSSYKASEGAGRRGKGSRKSNSLEETGFVFFHVHFFFLFLLRLQISGIQTIERKLKS